MYVGPGAYRVSHCLHSVNMRVAKVRPVTAAYASDRLTTRGAKERLRDELVVGNYARGGGSSGRSVGKGRASTWSTGAPEEGVEIDVWSSVTATENGAVQDVGA